MELSRYPGAFEGDPFIEAEVRRLVMEHGVRTIVETGTWRGETTRALSDMGVNEVVTIEIDQRVLRAQHLLTGGGNVRQVIGNSALVLPRLLEGLEGPILFYLDAHWGEHSPLLDELGAIGASGIKPVIVIHDFFNPLHPEYGFDSWDIGEYRLELIQRALLEIYGESGWEHWYNDEAAGLKRGVIYIEPLGKVEAL
jgi:hypothetical protein